MSHINDALKKAQKEKDTLYQRYRQMLPGQHSDDGVPEKTGSKRPVVCVAVLAIAAVALGIYLVSDRTATQEIAPENASSRHINAVQRQLPQPSATIAASPAAKNRAQATQDLDKTPENAAPATPHTRPPSRPAPSTMRSEPPHPAPVVTVPVAAPPFESLVNAQLSKQDTPPSKTPPAPKSPDPQKLFDSALKYQQHNNLREAEKLYVRILKIDPKFATAMNNLGVIYMSQKKFDNAIRLFKKAIYNRKDYVDPYYNLACVHSLSGNMAESFTYLKKAIGLKKDVKNWAKNDKDLSRLHNFTEFRELMGNEVKVSGERGDLYIVKEGEWIFDIIRAHYAVSDRDIRRVLNEIKKVNQALANSNIIYPGQKILLPPREDIEKIVQFNAERDTP